jgi:hypothetical protein
MIDQLQATKIIEGGFSASDSNELISTIIDSLIKYYKLQYLRQWIGNHNLSEDNIQNRINELQEKKRELESLIDEARRNGSELNLNALLEISVDD